MKNIFNFCFKDISYEDKMFISNLDSNHRLSSSIRLSFKFSFYSFIFSFIYHIIFYWTPHPIHTHPYRLSFNFTAAVIRIIILCLVMCPLLLVFLPFLQTNEPFLQKVQTFCYCCYCLFIFCYFTIIILF